MPAMAHMTAVELARCEKESERQLRTAVEAFINFPTATNEMIVVDRMGQFRHDWMNGRIRSTGD